MKNLIIIIQLIVIGILFITIFIIKFDTRPLFISSHETIKGGNIHTIEFREDFKLKVTVYATRYLDYMVSEKRKVEIKNGKISIEYIDKSVSIHGDNLIVFNIAEGTSNNSSISTSKLEWHHYKFDKKELPIFTLSFDRNENNTTILENDGKISASIEKKINEESTKFKEEMLKSIKKINGMNESNKNSIIITLEYN